MVRMLSFAFTLCCLACTSEALLLCFISFLLTALIQSNREMMARKVPPSEGGEEQGMNIPSFQLEHWPRLPTQRMKRRAHLFQSFSGAAINALAQIEPSKFLSAGADGTVRIWSPSEGKELYRMDGFTDSISSLVLAKDSLVTNGMENMVCLHDFGVDIDEAENGYEMEW